LGNFYDNLFCSIFNCFWSNQPRHRTSPPARVNQWVHHSDPRKNDIWQLDYKLDHPVLGITLGPATPEYHSQARHLPDAYEVLINPQMGFPF
jgi:hypothetical protein